jgi:hypothetical protein
MKAAPIMWGNPIGNSLQSVGVVEISGGDDREKN